MELQPSQAAGDGSLCADLAVWNQTAQEGEGEYAHEKVNLHCIEFYASVER